MHLGLVVCGISEFLLRINFELLLVLFLLLSPILPAAFIHKLILLDPFFIFDDFGYLRYIIKRVWRFKFWFVFLLIGLCERDSPVSALTSLVEQAVFSWWCESLLIRTTCHLADFEHFFRKRLNVVQLLFRVWRFLLSFTEESGWLGLEIIMHFLTLSIRIFAISKFLEILGKRIFVVIRLFNIFLNHRIGFRMHKIYRMF